MFVALSNIWPFATNELGPNEHEESHVHALQNLQIAVQELGPAI